MPNKCALPAAPSAKLMIGKREIITISPADAAAAGLATPLLLAQGWAKNIRNVVFPPPKPAAPLSTVPVPSTPAPQPSTQTAPSSPSISGLTRL